MKTDESFEEFCKGSKDQAVGGRKIKTIIWFFFKIEETTICLIGNIPIKSREEMM